MKIKLNYIDKIISVPAEGVVENIGSMSAPELKVLLYLCAEPDFRADTEANKAYAIKALDMQWAEIEAALSSLSSSGVINTDVPVEAAAEAKPKKQKSSVKADNPQYDKDEVSGIIERSGELQRLIHIDVPRIIGKPISANEIQIIVSMYDYLRLNAESIVKITEYCTKKGNASFRVIERTAYSLFDANVTTPEQIDEFIKKENAKNETVGRVRELYGIGNRALITKEKNLINTWTETYGYGIDMIERAYEQTITSIKEPSLDYTAAILKRWHEAGIKTTEQVDEDIAKSKPEIKLKKRKQNENAAADSFTTDEFFEAAMKRSYGEN